MSFQSTESRFNSKFSPLQSLRNCAYLRGRMSIILSPANQHFVVSPRFQPVIQRMGVVAMRPPLRGMNRVCALIGS